MADTAVVREGPLFERTGFRLSWGAIFAGLFVAISIHFVLSLLGVAIGLSAWSPGGEPGDVAMGVGIWAAIAALIALFAGGATTGRLAGVLNRLDGALHGTVLWALTTVVTIWLIMSGAGFLLGGAFDIAGRTAASAVQVGGGAAMELAGPALSATVQGADRDTLVSEIAMRTGLSESQADAVVTDVEQRIAQTRMDVRQQARQIQRRAPIVAEEVTSAAATGAWWALLALGLSFAAAAFGATMTARE